MNQPPEKHPVPAFLFDLDGTLIDSVYQHVLAWGEALERAGIELSVWRIHRKIGMSGGLLINALLREFGPARARVYQQRDEQFYTTNVADSEAAFNINSDSWVHV